MINDFLKGNAGQCCCVGWAWLEGAGSSLCKEKTKQATVLLEGQIQMLLGIKRMKYLMIESTSYRKFTVNHTIHLKFFFKVKNVMLLQTMREKMYKAEEYWGNLGGVKQEGKTPQKTNTHKIYIWPIKLLSLYIYTALLVMFIILSLSFDNFVQMFFNVQVCCVKYRHRLFKTETTIWQPSSNVTIQFRCHLHYNIRQPV